MALAEDESLDHRLVAVDVVTRLDPVAGKTLIGLLDPRHAQELQSAAAAALASADAPTATAMLAQWSASTTTTRRALADAALRSATGTAALVGALEQQQIAAQELDTSAARRPGGVSRPDTASADQASPAARGRRRSRGGRGPLYTGLVTREGERARGAALFEKHCLACHGVQGVGHRVGPDLSAVAAPPKETLLVDVFDPSRQVSADYMAYTLVTQQGQVLSGLLASETATSVTLAPRRRGRRTSCFARKSKSCAAPANR